LVDWLVGCVGVYTAKEVQQGTVRDRRCGAEESPQEGRTSVCVVRLVTVRRSGTGLSRSRRLAP